MSETAPSTALRGTCFYCGIEHERVDGGGLWSCPNPACLGCGAIWFRSKLPSYKAGATHHEVDDAEYRTACFAFAGSCEEEFLREYVLLTLRGENSGRGRKWETSDE